MKLSWEQIPCICFLISSVPPMEDKSDTRPVSLSLEDDIWLYPKIVMFQPEDESAFSLPKKIKTVPKLSS